MTFEDQIVRGSFTGTTSADVLEISLPSMSAAMVQITGTFTATTIFEVLVDEGSSPTWKAISATNVTTGTSATTTTAAGVFSIGVAGARRFRARCSAYTNGTVVVAINVSRGSAAGSASSGGGGGGGAVTIADGADVAQGTTTDAGVVTDTTGTVIGFLRGNIIQWISQLSRMGSLTEAAPATDTASSGLNGRLQRIAQRITSLIALLPSALVGGRLDTNVGAIPGTVSTANSSTATLGGGAVFTGTGEDVSGYASIFVSLFTDQASAASGLSLQFSSDNTNWDHTRAITVGASAGMILSASPALKFFRVVYTNGATPNTVFRLQTIYRPVEVTRSISVFTDVNGTQSTAAMGQRVFADLMVQDATGNATNRMRSARDLAASPGAGGTFPAVGSGGHDGTNWRPIAVSTTGQLAIGQGTVGPAKIEDAGHTTGDVGSFILGVRQDTQSALAGTTLDYIPITTDANGSVREVSGGYTSVVAATLTRPANTTAYASGDEMTDTGGAILTFTSAARFSGGTGTINGLQITNSQNAATKATGELRLYDTTSTPATDNAAFDANDTVNDTCVAVIPFTTASDGLTGTGGNCVYDINSLNIPFLTSGSANLFGRIILKSAYTSPNNSDTWKFKLRIMQD